MKTQQTYSGGSFRSHLVSFKILFFSLLLMTACGDSEDEDPTPPGSTEDTTPPEITSISPADGATNVPVDVEIKLTLSETLDINTIKTGTLTLSGGGSSDLAWQFVISGTSATIKPDNPLKESTEYTLRLTTAVKDKAGNALKETFSSQFTTTDTSAPTITEKSPSSGDENVELNTPITVNFSEDIDASTVTSSTFQVKVNTSAVSGSFNVNDNTVTFNPDSDFAGSTQVTVTVGGIEDLNGNAFDGTAWSFTTRSTQTLSVSGWTPGTDAVRVGIDEKVVVTFSDNIDASSVNSNFFLYDYTAGSYVNGSLSVSGKVVTFTPTNSLTEFKKLYGIIIKAAIKDVDGNTMPSDYTEKFTTIILDGDYLYRINPYYSNNDTRVFDNGYNNDDYYPTFMGTWGNYSGQKWHIKYYNGDKYFTMTSLTGGDTKLLDSGDGTDVAYCSSGVNANTPFTGQMWYFTYNRKINGRQYYFLSSKYQENSKYLSFDCKMAASESLDESWSFERLNKK